MNVVYQSLLSLDTFTADLLYSTDKYDKVLDEHSLSRWACWLLAGILVNTLKHHYVISILCYYMLWSKLHHACSLFISVFCSFMAIASFDHCDFDRKYVTSLFVVVWSCGAMCFGELWQYVFWEVVAPWVVWSCGIMCCREMYGDGLLGVVLRVC